MTTFDGFRLTAVTLLRRGGALCVAATTLATPILLGGCGSDEFPSGTAARIGELHVKRSTLAHWNSVASRAPNADGAVFDPPLFRRCTVLTTRALRKRAGGQARVPGYTQIRGLCEQGYKQFRDRVMRAVVGASWVEGEARRLGIRVSDVEVRRRVRLVRRGRAPVRRGSSEFRLAWTGLFPAEQPFWVRMTLLAEKLHAQVLRRADRPSRAEIDRHYQAHRARYAVPEQRDVQAVEVSTRADAEAARKALDAGEGWAVVARRWSIDRTTNRRGGRLVGVQRGLRGPGFDRAVFSAHKGVLSGPVRTPLGFGIFKVTAINRAHRRTLAQARPSIRRLLTRQRRDEVWARFLRDFSKRWRARTQCAKELAVSDCDNAS
jgi:foldase protein PrsA